MLENKIAVVYGAGGAVGGAVARAFARSGAKVYLVGRSEGGLATVADEIAAQGGWCRTERLDAADAAAVGRHLDTVVAEQGRVDACFNAVTYGDVQGSPLVAMPFDEFSRPIVTALRVQHAVFQAAARHMAPAGAGAVMTVTGYGPPHPEMGGTMVTWATVESVCRQWASELGPQGVRVVWLRTAGFVESLLDAPDYGSSYAGDTSGEELLSALQGETMLKRLPTLTEAGELAVFLASDHARSVTATAVNVTAGAVAD
ncbi:SDR family oxidoreductase [Spiractinospora alimapuensis]|nr:SDR family oxidoreductase [Spiractinospora alimapuensis]